jgi:hypothetical protein
MPDNNGNLLMVFDTMSNTLDPSIQYTARHTTDAHGTFENNIFLIKATKPLNIGSTVAPMVTLEPPRLMVTPPTTFGWHQSMQEPMAIGPRISVKLISRAG